MPDSHEAWDAAVDEVINALAVRLKQRAALARRRKARIPALPPPMRLNAACGPLSGAPIAIRMRALGSDCPVCGAHPAQACDAALHS